MAGFNVLDPKLNLHRNYFLEASAGTGKTFTIENIVVRLLEEGLEIDQVLVVTFTRAATLELKMRIRHNLEKKGLRKALMRFEHSQIYTIHGFCFHLLKEFALETGFPLHATGESASPDLLSKILNDFFRCELSAKEIHPKQLEKILKKNHYDLGKLYLELMKPQTVRGRTYEEIWQQLEGEIAHLQYDREELLDRLIDYASRFSGLCDRKRKIKAEYE
jgi:exodeoxyribonuclease V beta subunit